MKTNQNYALAIHTASPDLGLAIGTIAGEPRIQVWKNLGRDLSTEFHDRLAVFLSPQNWADLAFIAVAKGPGGFTGTRLGVVAARTLAQQLDIPLFAVSTLAVIAWDAYLANFQETWTLPPSDSEWVEIAVQMPAQRGELHTAIYSVLRPNSEAIVSSQSNEEAMRPVLKVKRADAVLNQDEWLKTLAELQTPYQLVQAEGGLGQTAAALLDLANLEWQSGHRPHWSEALPFYGQSPV